MSSCCRAFAQSKRCLLLNRLLSPWYRRGAKLLQVGLGSELCPDYFWQAGFDVSALDSSASRLEKFREKTGKKVDYYLGQPDQQPFDDKSFDIVVLNHLGLEGEDGMVLLEEARRLALRGLVILEWNKYSLGVYNNQQAQPRVSAGRLTSMARQVCRPCRVRMRSVLPLPPSLWPETLPDGDTLVSPEDKEWPFFQDTLFVIPIGALLGLRVELEPLSMSWVGSVSDQPKPYKERQVAQVTHSEDHAFRSSSSSDLDSELGRDGLK